MVRQRSKEQWRTAAKANRAGLRIDHGRVCAGLARFLASVQPGWIVGYLAMPGEPDLGALLTRTDLGPFAVTRTPDDGFDLTVHPAGSELERHRYGFDQPVAGSPAIPDDEISVVLVPGLAFDLEGNRLGHGVGYYDRFLTRLEPSVLRVGVTDGFLVSGLPHDRLDVSMTHLATEIGVIPANWS